jgi:hypothetical protein
MGELKWYQAINKSIKAGSEMSQKSERQIRWKKSWFQSSNKFCKIILIFLELIKQLFPDSLNRG